MLPDSSIVRYEIPRGKGMAVCTDDGEIRIEHSPSHVTLGWPSTLTLDKLAQEARRVSGRSLKRPLVGTSSRVREVHHLCLLRFLFLLRPRPTFLRLDGHRLTMVIQQSALGYQLAAVWPGQLQPQEASQLLSDTADPITQARAWQLVKLAKDTY
jgi:hypothetical protein